MVSDFKKTQNFKISEFEYDFSEIDLVFDEKISDLKLKWNNTFACYGRLEPLSFACILEHLSKEAEKSRIETGEGDTGCVETVKENTCNLEFNFLDNNLCDQPSKEDIEDLSPTKIQNDGGYLIQDNTTMPEADHSKFYNESDNLLSNRERHSVEYKVIDEEVESLNLKNSVPVKNNEENTSCGNKNEECTNISEQQALMKKPKGDLINLNENFMFEKEKYSVNNDTNAAVDDKNVLSEHLINETGEKPSVYTRYKNQGNKNEEINKKEQKNNAKSTFFIVILFSLSTMICLIVYFTFIKPK
jgi:hypothetical protein